MGTILYQREVPPKFDHGSQFTIVLKGAADRFSSCVVDSEHAGILHEIALRELGCSITV